MKAYPEHKSYLLTSTQYASELKICELAHGYNKLVKKSDGEEFMISPFAPVNLPQLNKNEIETNINHLNEFVSDQSKSNEQDEVQNGPMKFQKLNDKLHSEPMSHSNNQKLPLNLNLENTLGGSSNI